MDAHHKRRPPARATTVFTTRVFGAPAKVIDRLPYRAGSQTGLIGNPKRATPAPIGTAPATVGAEPAP